MSNPTSSISPPRRRAPAILFFVGVALFIAIAADVTHQGRLVQADRAIAPYLYNHASGTLTFLAACFSGVGDPWLVVPYAVAGGILLAVRRRWRAVVVWGTGFIGSNFICEGLKHYFHVPRPSRYLTYVFSSDHPGFTFPSGHTMGATMAAGLTVLLLLHTKPRAPRTRLFLAAAAAFVGTLEAASLLYIGVHYLTDVLGGLAISAAWLGVLAVFLPPAVPQTPQQPLNTAAAEEISSPLG